MYLFEIIMLVISFSSKGCALNLFHSTLTNCQAFYTRIARWLKTLRFWFVLLMFVACRDNMQ